MRPSLMHCVAAACFGLTCQAASADILFSDNFETAPDPTPLDWATQQATPALRTQSDPANTVYASFSAQPGNWFRFNAAANPQHDIQVTSHPIPGAFQGTNYLRIHRDATQDSAAIAAAFAPHDQNITSGIVTASFRARFPSSNTTGFHGGIFMTSFLDNDHGAGTTGSKPTMFVRDGGVIRLSFGGFANNPDLASPVAVEDQWQQWVVTANVNNQTFTVSIDGVTSAPQAWNFPEFIGTGINGLAFSGISEAEFFIDDLVIDGPPVPEPASLSLLAVGAGAMLRRRRAL